MRLRTLARQLDKLERRRAARLAERAAGPVEPGGAEERAALAPDPEGPEHLSLYLLAALETYGADGDARVMLTHGTEVAAAEFVGRALRSILGELHGAEFVGAGDMPPMPRVKGRERFADPGPFGQAQGRLRALLLTIAEGLIGRPDGDGPDGA